MHGFMAPAPSTQNPSAQESASQPLGVGTASTELYNGQSAEQHTDSLAKGKERAKAMLASGLQQSSNPPSRNPSNPPLNHDIRSHNTTPMSGKRPRSQSQHHDVSLPQHAQLNLKQFIARDQANAAAKIRENERQRLIEERMAEERRILEEWSVQKRFNAQRQPTRVIYRSEKAPPAGRKTKQLFVSAKQARQQFEKGLPEELCPIRLDIESGNLRLRDTFTWNIHDRLVPHELFIHGLVEDFKIPSDAVDQFYQEALKQFEDQLQDFHPHPYIKNKSLDAELPYNAYKDDDMRVLIKLNITIGKHQLIDQFEWDINCPLNSPEEFARLTAKELSLSGEFTSAIAHSIREQCQVYTKALYMAGHQWDGRPIEASEIKEHLQPSPLPSVFRNSTSAKEHSPAFFELDEKGQYAQELAYEREQRQKKRSGNRGADPRSGRGGVLTLPDLKERPSINRTRVVSSVIPGAASTTEDSGIYRMTPKKKRPWNAGRGAGAALADDSDDDLEASSSEGESPIRGAGHLLGGGTSRTRGMRGAAAAAQSAMRRNYNERSVSPETSTPARPPITKTTALRFHADHVYEEYDEEDGERVCLVLKFKMPRERFRQWWRDWKRLAPIREQEAQMKARRQQMEMQQVHARQSASATPVPPGLMGPPSTPGMSGRGLPGSGSTPRPGSRLAISDERNTTPTPASG